MVMPLAHRHLAYQTIVERIGAKASDSKTRVYINEMRTWVSGSLNTSIKSLIAMHANPDPTQTKAYNDKKLITAAAQLDKKRKEIFEKIQTEFQEGLQDLQMRIEDKVKLKPDAYAAEIRAAIRAMPQAERVAAMKQLALDNNGPALAAITEAPAILSGVTPLLQEQYRSYIYNAHAKEEIAEQTELQEAFQAAMSATDVAKMLADDLNNPTRLAEIEIGVKAAADADAAFDTSTGS